MKIKLILVALMLTLSGYSAADNKAETPRVASAMPIIHAINQALLEGTDVEAIYLPPKRLPVSRINNWLKHKSGAVISKQGPVTAVVSIESIWPEYALFKHLRATNVRVINVDAAQEILPGGAQVSLSAQDSEQSTYFWLAPDNLRVMSQIVAREFQRIWPGQAPIIRSNQMALQKQISDYALKLDETLLEHDVVAVCLDNPKLQPLAQATYLPVEEECSEALQIKPKSKKLEPQSGLWLVDTAIKPLKTDLTKWLSNNLNQLDQAFQH
ncbi:hypothetical protein ACMXYV_07295 [Neptuniibacter sp. SY11_33]|uniref:hypothetical protein n=1 Tax=Neptuniibacter sp. SY11_33 TaxID=3398215 RepID=UPI0039F4E03A